MRELDKQEVPALGKKIEHPPMPKPHHKVTQDGSVRRDPSGKFYTEQPGNEIANKPAVP